MSFQVRKIQEKKPKRSFPWKATIIGSLQVLRPLVQWYETKKKREEAQEQRSLLLKRTLVILVTVLIAFFLIAGMGHALTSLKVLSLKDVFSVAGADLPVDEQGYTNILLLGEGDDDHDGKDLTDTIMIASLDPENTQSVVLLSLPRDLYMLSTEKMGKGRINSLYRDYKNYLVGQGANEDDASQEAMKQLVTEIGTAVKMDIHHALKVNFSGFVQAVDAVGGIDVEVPYDIADETYPDENHGYEPFYINKGPHHLDGETALKYVRSRHTSSDFGRSARQQQVIVALAEKARAEGLHKNPKAIADFVNIFNENVESTMSLRELIGLGGIGEAIDRTKIVAMQLNDRNGLYGSFTEAGGFLYTPPRDQFGGAAVLLPVSIPEFPVTWKQIQSLTILLFRFREAYLARPTISILNAGARSGLARTLGSELIRYGFNVDIIENADVIEDLEQSRVSGQGEEWIELSDFFASLLNIEATPVPPELPFEQQRNITIILGSSYSYTPLQNLVPSAQ